MPLLSNLQLGKKFFKNLTSSMRIGTRASLTTVLAPQKPTYEQGTKIMKSLLSRGLVTSLFVIAGARAFATDYKLYYCYADQKWVCTGKDGKIGKNIPTFERGDNIKLFVIQNTLRTKVKVEFAEEAFGSTTPTILSKLLPGVPTAAPPSALTGDEETVTKALANLYPIAVETFRQVTPAYPSAPNDSQASNRERVYIEAR
jgi:hypothetical protein